MLEIVTVIEVLVEEGKLGNFFSNGLNHYFVFIKYQVYMCTCIYTYIFKRLYIKLYCIHANFCLLAYIMESIYYLAK